ncbi:MAG: gamma-glutamyltransferase [Alphaproteobacteria bacterium]|nr:gamma-glutamyltransferase [Alphaproteobacteria bacterium]
MTWMLVLGAPSIAEASDRARGAVSSDHALASACGAEILERGGNAADAAVATALCAGVVQPSGSGLGGGGFAVVVDAKAPQGAVLDFREAAPAAAHRDMYLASDGTVVPNASTLGGLAVAVPAESRGLAQLLATHGSLPARVVAGPAIRLAARGFRVGDHLVASLQAPTSDDVVAELDVRGHAATWGDVLKRPALARTLRRWASTRGEDLADGKGAASIVAWADAHGGVLGLGDLSRYAVRDRAPIVVPFHGYTVVTMPPPSSGGVVLAQVLRVLEGYDLQALGWNSAAYLHLLTEAFKHAYADRAHYLGDPDFVDVPVARLLSDARVAEVRAAIDPTTTLPPEAYGSLVGVPDDHGTQHISVVDGRGGAVALTTTINTRFGSQLVPPDLGIILNNEMDDFSAAPGVPNAYGLVGDEANAIAGGKRPLSSMSPTIVLDDQGRVVLVVGASGGSTIISATVQVLLDVLVFDVDPADAVAATRIHHQWQPDKLFVEPTLPRDVVSALEALGHHVTVWSAPTAVQAVRVGTEGLSQAGADPRKGGAPALAWP